jgi:hypothetical protein
VSVLGADPPVVILTLTSLGFILWAWATIIRRARILRRMAQWLEIRRAEAWAALPWTARRLLPQSGIAALSRRGLTDDPEFGALLTERRRLERLSLGLLLLGAVMIGLLLVGLLVLGWDA